MPLFPENRQKRRGTILNGMKRRVEEVIYV